MYDSSNQSVITSGPETDEKTVVMTFDDGPGRYLTQILDVLKQEKVPAMFFWQTRLLYPNRPWQRVLDEGHLIGSHTVKHNNLVNLTFDEQLTELQNSIRSIESITGQSVSYIRPPFGQFNEETVKAAKELGTELVMWKVASLDWELKCDPQQIIRNVTDNLENGAIILLHELKQTAEILPELIQAIKAKGYGFNILA